jgi:hypothetical protein
MSVFRIGKLAPLDVMSWHLAGNPTAPASSLGCKFIRASAEQVTRRREAL